MDLQKMIADEMIKKFESGDIQKKIEDYTNKMIDETLKSAITGYGGIGTEIEKKLKEQMCKQIEKFNFENYLPKLENVLEELIINTTFTGKKMIDNFKSFMKIERFSKIKMSDIFEKYKEFVAENVDTTELKIDYDDDVTYENVIVNLESETGYISSYLKIKLSCEQDDQLEKIFELRKSYDKDEYRLIFCGEKNLLSLGNLDSFDVFLIQLENNYASIEKDTESEEYEVEVEAKPEADYN